MGEGANPGRAEPTYCGDREVSDGCSGGSSEQRTFDLDDQETFDVLVSLANVMLTNNCGRRVADEHARDIASRCFEKISAIKGEDDTGIQLTVAYLRRHVWNRMRNLYKKLERERSEAEARLPIDPDQLADPNSFDPDDHDFKQATRRSQIEVLVRRCLKRHVKKKRDRTILMDFYSGVSQADLARDWGLSRPRIYQIIVKSEDDV